MAIDPADERLGLVGLARPATIVRTSVPTSTVSFSSFFDFGTRSAASTLATRRSTFMKSSKPMRASAALLPGAAASGTAAGAAAAGPWGAEAGGGAAAPAKAAASRSGNRS